MMIPFCHRMNRRMTKICWEPLDHTGSSSAKPQVSDSVSEALRLSAALEANKEEDQVEVEVANVIDAHPGK